MKPSKVMIVDDSPVDLQHLKQIIADAGFQVITATDGQDAYDKAKTYRPDVILMDILLPDCSGLELARRWRPDVLAGVKKTSAHLAMDDIKDSIAELQHYRATFFKME